jgi:hypothetical protein
MFVLLKGKETRRERFKGKEEREGQGKQGERGLKETRRERIRETRREGQGKQGQREDKGNKERERERDSYRKLLRRLKV